MFYLILFTLFLFTNSFFEIWSTEYPSSSLLLENFLPIFDEDADLRLLFIVSIYVKLNAFLLSRWICRK